MSKSHKHTTLKFDDDELEWSDIVEEKIKKKDQTRREAKITKLKKIEELDNAKI